MSLQVLRKLSTNSDVSGTEFESSKGDIYLDDDMEKNSTTKKLLEKIAWQSSTDFRNDKRDHESSMWLPRSKSEDSNRDIERTKLPYPVNNDSFQNTLTYSKVFEPVRALNRTLPAQKVPLTKLVNYKNTDENPIQEESTSDQQELLNTIPESEDTATTATSQTPKNSSIKNKTKSKKIITSPHFYDSPEMHKLAYQDGAKSRIMASKNKKMLHSTSIRFLTDNDEEKAYPSTFLKQSSASVTRSVGSLAVSQGKYPLPPIGDSQATTLNRVQNHNKLAQETDSQFDSEPLPIIEQAAVRSRSQSLPRQIIRNKIVFDSNLPLGNEQNEFERGTVRKLVKGKESPKVEKLYHQSSDKSEPYPFEESFFEPKNYSRKRKSHSRSKNDTEYHRGNPNHQQIGWSRDVLGGSLSAVAPEPNMAYVPPQRDYNGYYSDQGYGYQSYNDQNYGRRRSLDKYDRGNTHNQQQRRTSVEYDGAYGDEQYDIADDWKYQIEEKKRLEKEKKERERYDNYMLDQTVARQQQQMEEEYEREKQMKIMKEEARRKKQESHQRYIEQLALEKRIQEGDSRPTTNHSAASSVTFNERKPSYESNPYSKYSKYDRTIAKGTGKYKFDDKSLGPKSRPLIKESPRKQITPPDKNLRDKNIDSRHSTRSDASSKSKKSTSERSKSNRYSKSENASRQDPQPRTEDPYRSHRSSGNSVSSKSKEPVKVKSILKQPSKQETPSYKEPAKDYRYEEEEAKPPTPPPSPPKIKKTKPKKEKPVVIPPPQNEFKRRKLPNKNSNYDFGLNLMHANQQTSDAKKEYNPFFDSEPGRRRKTPDNRAPVRKNNSRDPPRANSHHDKDPPPRTNSHRDKAASPPPEAPQSRVMMDSEVQASGPDTNDSEVQATKESIYTSTQTETESNSNSAQTYEEDFEQLKPKTPTPPPTPFDWKITMEDPMSNTRLLGKDPESQAELEYFEEEHHGLQSQLLAIKQELKVPGDEDTGRRSSRSRGKMESRSSNRSSSSNRNENNNDLDETLKPNSTRSTRSRRDTRDGRTSDGRHTSDSKASRDGRKTSDSRHTSDRKSPALDTSFRSKYSSISRAKSQPSRSSRRGKSKSPEERKDTSLKSPNNNTLGSELSLGKKNAFEDTMINLENTDRTVLSQFMTKTNNRTNSRDGRNTSEGYQPSSGERTRQGTPKEESPRTPWDERPKTNHSKEEEDENWEEKKDYLKRNDTEKDLDLDATDRTVLEAFKERHS